ncbi:K(+)/H(+) antiporter NhaP2 [Halomonas elongata]|uniref:K(+)/H(+) antiporter NhaP2 n=1 Tax=Halomonas elongata TaxID=2746 RepID=A0A1B8P260_HALEL|nr:K(+)/H(+) antiporter NhaP2 [Halomonas elongata]
MRRQCSRCSARGINLNERVGATLEIESGTNDPMAIFLTLMLVEHWPAISVASGTGLFFVQQFGLGIVIGIGAGWVAGRLLSWLDLGPVSIRCWRWRSASVSSVVTSALGGSGFLAIYLTA